MEGREEEEEDEEDEEDEEEDEWEPSKCQVSSLWKKTEPASLHLFTLLFPQLLALHMEFIGSQGDGDKGSGGSYDG